MSAPGRLMPGVFSARHHKTLAREADRRRMAGKAAGSLLRNPKKRFEPALGIMSLVDWYVQHQLPLPSSILVAIAHGLEVRSALRRRNKAASARRLHDSGLTWEEVARRLGVSKRQTMRIAAEAVPDPIGDEAQATETFSGIEDSALNVERRLKLWDGIEWHSRHGLPLSYDGWWALICALGLGTGGRSVLVRPASPVISEEERLDAEIDYITLGWDRQTIEREIADPGQTTDEVEAECDTLGLTKAETDLALQGRDVIRMPACGEGSLKRDTVLALTGGVYREEARIAAMNALAKARASQPQPQGGFKGAAPLTDDKLAEIAANADGGGGKNEAGEAGGNPDNRVDTIREWTSNPSWEPAVRSRTIVAKHNVRAEDIVRQRREAVQLIGTARAQLPPDHSKTGCEPFTKAQLEQELGLNVLEDCSALDTWMRDTRRWEGDCAIWERRMRAKLNSIPASSVE